MNTKRIQELELDKAYLTKSLSRIYDNPTASVETEIRLWNMLQTIEKELKQLKGEQV